jgi:hypothetical protein
MLSYRPISYETRQHVQVSLILIVACLKPIKTSQCICASKNIIITITSKNKITIELFFMVVTTRISSQPM